MANYTSGIAMGRANRLFGMIPQVLLSLHEYFKLVPVIASTYEVRRRI